MIFSNFYNDWNTIQTWCQVEQWSQNDSNWFLNKMVWKTNWFIGTFLNFCKNLHFSLGLFFDWAPRFDDKIWVVKRPHNSILSIHTQIIPIQTNLGIMNHDLVWSQKVPWIVFISNTNIAFVTNYIDICFWAKKSKKSELWCASSESYITSANQLFRRFCYNKVVSDVWFEHFFQKLIY